MREPIQIYLSHGFWGFVGAAERLLEGTYAGRILAAFWELVAQLWLLVVLGALVSTLAWRFLPRTWIQQKLQRRAGSSIVLASLLGVVSPICTFAAIPLVGALAGLGLPAPPLVAFLIASPLMNPSLFVYTAGTIGLEMAVARLISAFSLGIFAGFAALLAQGRGIQVLGPPVAEKMPQGHYPAVAGGTALPPIAHLRLLLERFAGDLAFVARYFALGIFIAALVEVFVSSTALVRFVGGRWGVPLAVLLGAPLYACGGGNLPVVERLLRLGMSPGAALAFFIAGPATRFSTLSVLGAVFGRRLLLLYLAVMLSGALLWGYLYPFHGHCPAVPKIRYSM